MPRTQAIPLLYFKLAFTFLLVGCTEPPSKSTHTLSSDFATLEGKKEFLEKYVKFRRTYEKLNFSISYRDGGSGAIPGPSEWDIRIAAKIPARESQQWTTGLTPTKQTPDTRWVAEVPNAPKNLEKFTWYSADSRVVGFDKTQSLILYRNHTH